MAESLAFNDRDETTETTVLIRMINRCLDCMNVRSKLEGKYRRKDVRLPYSSSNDHSFKVINPMRYLSNNNYCVTHYVVAQAHIFYDT